MKAHHVAFKAATRYEPTSAAFTVSDRSKLTELAEGPYCILSLMFDAASLCQLDASCRLLWNLNRANVGPWQAVGTSVFRGLELENDGVFEEPRLPVTRRLGEFSSRHKELTAKKVEHFDCDWKDRYRHFWSNVATLCSPFQGSEITAVAHPDEVAYFRCRLCTDVLDDTSQGVYVEVEVLANPDNVSMAVVDFEAGGCSSVTFSPDTGAVIRERKVREAPRRVEGEYIQPLLAVAPGRRFCGLMGLYLCQGRLAFFRRCSVCETDDTLQREIADDGDASMLGGVELGSWETTGFVSDLSWAEGRRLTPCLAFRDEGAYQVKVVFVGKKPPVARERWGVDNSAQANWNSFDWEVSPFANDAADP